MTANGFAEKLHELLPRVKARREEIEEARRLPKDLVADLTATGIFRLGVPAALGGEEALATDLMRAFETIAAADGSTGWCAMIMYLCPRSSVTRGTPPRSPTTSWCRRRPRKKCGAFCSAWSRPRRSF